MISAIDKLTEAGCATHNKDRVCRSRGGESCAFDGAMIVLQPIADAAHLVHGPIACCGNSWEGRGTLSSKGALHTMGFTTDMSEIDIVYGSEEKLFQAIIRTHESVSPKAIFVYSTCVSGLTGEDIDAVCRRAEHQLDIRVIPVHSPGFVGPKNLGNRIAGEVLLEQVIGTGEPPVMTPFDINLIGEYNIAGDLWLIEPLLAKAGIRILSKITGDSTFEEITWAHHAKLNVVVCSRALINVAKEMERKYGIPFVEVSFFGSTEIAKALRAIGSGLSRLNGSNGSNQIEAVIRQEEKKLKAALKPYQHLRGKRAVLYTGGVKSWSFISALRDLGIEIVAVGTKKSTVEDEEKMKEILGPGAPLVEDVTPKNLLRLLKERNADILVAGGRNQYLAVKEGYPFVDVNQERHSPYAGHLGLANLAEQISNSLRFYANSSEQGVRSREQGEERTGKSSVNSELRTLNSELRINPLKHSPAIGAAIALQGINAALPIIHGAQGCAFLGKVLLTKHFREPIALATSKLFVEDVVMGSEEKLTKAVQGFIDKNGPDLIGVLTSGLSEVKGDDVARVMKQLETRNPTLKIVHIPTPDYDGGLEAGYARAVKTVIESIADGERTSGRGKTSKVLRPTPNAKSMNVIAGSHLTPGDVNELRELVEAFGMRAIILPDLSALDGSRQGFSPLATGGTAVQDIQIMDGSDFTIALGRSMEPAAKLLQQKFGIEYRVFDSIAGLADTDLLVLTLARISNRPVPARYERQRRALVDGMRDAHVYYGSKTACIALEPDLATQTSKWLDEMGAAVELAVIPTLSDAADHIRAREVQIGDLFSIRGEFDVLIANSHAESTAKRLGVPLYEMGFPVYKTLGYPSKVTIGYRGTLTMINEMANLLMKRH
jgi:nitrogenase molybdenum-cofactor synthesis protein NifE